MRAMLASFVLVGLAGTAYAGPVLEVWPATLTSNKMDSTASAGQDILPLALQRGVGIDGTMRAGSTLGWSLAGNPMGESWNGSANLAGVNAATGAPSVSAVDMALPSAGPRWVVGRTYNPVQTDNTTATGGHRDSDGYQGRNWFQSSQPEIFVYVDTGSPVDHAKDVVYIVYGADRYIELARTSSTSTEYKAKNGAAGVVQYVSGSPDTWVYTDQMGNKTTFFGGNTSSGAADWQFWKMADEAGNTIYVGDKTTASTAVTSGYTGKRITKAYDQADRRYTYTYTTLDSKSRLTQVKAETRTGGTWASPTGLATVGQVDYTYYQTGDNTHGDNGNLRTVKVTTPLSDGTTNLENKTLYRYYTGAYNGSTNIGNPHQLKMIVGSEGTRKYDWDQDGNLDDDFLTASTDTLKPYSDAYFTYFDLANGDSALKARVLSVFMNGQCGCSGGGGNGTFTYTYETSTSYTDGTGYDTGWYKRAVVTEPGGKWTTQYMDEAGQPLSRVVTTAAPTGTPTTFWATQVVRNSSGQLTEIRSPANITAYTHTNTSPNPSFTASTSAGLVTRFTRVGSGDAAGLLASDGWQQGTAGEISVVNELAYSTSVTLTVGTETLVRPVVTSTTRYESVKQTGVPQVSGPASSATITATSGKLATKNQVSTAPTPSTANNGSNAASSTASFLSDDKLASFSKSADTTPVISYRAMSATTGLVTTSITDANTAHADLTGVTIPSTPTSYATSGTALHLKTTYTYDAQGRPSTTTAPDGLVSQQYITLLADHRIVRLSVPRVVTSGSTTYYGPVSYTVSNQAGGVEFQGLIAFSGTGGSTTTAISGWITTTASDPITAIATGTLERMGTSVYSSDGHRVSESRSYFLLPSSGAGTEGTNYDATRFAYDDAGRRWRTKDATGTISRTVFDALGRSTESWIGTNDSSFSGGESSGTDTMVKTTTMVYDAGGSKANSLLTTRTADADGNWGTTGDQRVTTYIYDARNRAVVTTNPQSPHSVVKYDNLSRVVASASYSSTSGFTAATDPTSTATGRLSLSETSYDGVGRTWKSVTHKVLVADGSFNTTNDLITYTWYDAAGRVMKSMGSSISKTAYDRLGRATNQFAIGKTDDAAAATAQGYTDAGTVTGDTVLDERQTYFDATSGLALMLVSIARHHDDTSTTGALDTDSDLSLVDFSGSKIKGRAQIAVTFYDAWRRPTDSVAYGTNAAANYDRDSESTAPARSDTKLVSTTTYNTDGTVLESTDPRGLVSRNVLDDAGRTTKTIRNYTDGTPGGGTNNDQDQTIEYAYSKGLMTTYTAKVPGGTDQVTSYIFGTTKGATAGLSNIATGNLLRATKYPDSSNSGTTVANIDSTDADVVSIAYNALGQEIRRKDHAGNVTETTYDTAGRPTVRAVTTLASGFDGTVRRVEMAYTSKGQSDTVTQYDAATSGSVTDQVQSLYDDWGNVTNFRQDKDGTVAGGGYVETAFAYTSTPYQATGGGQAVRLTGMTLPGGGSVSYSYGTAASLNDCTSRVYEVSLASTTIARYQYLGSGTLVGTELPETGSISNLFGTGTANYDAIDAFGRTKISRWGKSGGRKFYEVELTYDRDSNITAVDDMVLVGYDAKYDTDGLNRLIVADEGTLSSGTIGTRTRKETWGLNQVGGWATFTSDLDGNGSFSSPAFGPTDEKNETRTFNTVNELSTRLNNGVTKSPAFNALGQQTDDGVNYTYEWDAFGRLRKVKNRSNAALVVEYTYNGLNMQIGRHADLDADGDVDTTDKWEWTIYDPRWRRAATVMVAGGTAFTGSPDNNGSGTIYIKERYVHHAAGRSGMGSYIDSLILRDRDQTNGNNGASDGTMEKRLYYCQNWRADVSVAMTDTGRILEWFKYSAYGVVQRLPMADYNRDTFVDFFDDGDFDTAYTASSTTADINYDGVVNATDDSQWTTSYTEQGTSARGVLADSGASAATNRIGYASYFFEPSTQQYLVRHRELDPLVGIWDERDPMGYHEGAGLYAYVAINPVRRIDPSGLVSRQASMTTDRESQSGDCTECEKCLGEALRDSTIQSLISMVKSTNGCGSGLFRFDESENIKCFPGTSDDNSYATTFCSAQPLSPTISFKCDDVSGIGCDRFKRILAHELVHAIDCCAGDLPPDSERLRRAIPTYHDCFSTMCTEIRGCMMEGCGGVSGLSECELAECCRIKVKQDYWTLNSCRAAHPDAFEDAISAGCADLRRGPFTSIPYPAWYPDTDAPRTCRKPFTVASQIVRRK